MGIGYRIKEARERLGLTQTELGAMIGVTGSAITNYEKETSHPKEQIIYKLMETLNIDANYLFQDAVKLKSSNNVSLLEYELVKKYRDLDEHGKKMVDFTLHEEWKRSTSKLEEGQLCFSFDSDHQFNIIKNGKSVPYDSRKNTTNAANAIENSSPEDKKHDEDIMDSDNF